MLIIMYIFVVRKKQSQTNTQTIMKHTKWSLLLATILLACSCNTDDVQSPEDDTTPVPGYKNKSVSFSARVQATSRATDLQFEEGDKISVFASETGYIEENNFAQNIRYTYDNDLFTTNFYLTYPSATQDLTFFAVYPYGNYTTPEFEFAVKKDQRSYDDYTSSDLMTASAVGNNAKVVDLLFSHRLAKLVINISSEGMPAGEQKLVIKNAKYIAAADLSANSFSSVEGKNADIIASSNGTNSFKVLLPPQVFSKGSLFAEITIGGMTFEWVLDHDIILNSGVEYPYTVEIKDSVAFTAQINPWGEPEAIESVIPDEYLDLLEPYIPIYTGTTPPNVEGTYLISPMTMVMDSHDNFEPGYQFADNYIQFYNQTSDNTISCRSTQLLGDLSVGEGLFISGEGENFTIYFNEYTTEEDGSWLVKATIISGQAVDGLLYDYTYAFIILDDYDVNDQYMDVGQYRVFCEGDGVCEQTTWPLDTRTNRKATGISIYAK